MKTSGNKTHLCQIPTIENRIHKTSKFSKKAKWTPDYTFSKLSQVRTIVLNPKLLRYSSRELPLHKMHNQTVIKNKAPILHRYSLSIPYTLRQKSMLSEYRSGCVTGAMYNCRKYKIPNQSESLFKVQITNTKE